MTDRLNLLLSERVNETIEDVEGLRALLNARIEEAKWVWPDIGGSADEFAGYIGERIPHDTEVADALRRMKISDLYLAWGCASGDEAALNAFTIHFDEMVSGAISRFANQGLDIDDAKQKVIEFILLPSSKRAAAINLYAGHGSLKGYLGVTVVREVLRMLKAAKKVPTIDMQDPANAFADSDHDPELQLLKQKYRTEFKQAFQDSFQALDAPDRNLLRYYYVTDLTLMQIATIAGVKHNTVSRRLAKIRSSLLTGTRDRLIKIAGIRHNEFESIVRLVQSQLNVSMYRMLDSKADERDPE